MILNKKWNSSLTDQPTFEYDESGKITGYKTKIGGADTVFPFSSVGLNKYSISGTFQPSYLEISDITISDYDFFEITTSDYYTIYGNIGQMIARTLAVLIYKNGTTKAYGSLMLNRDSNNNLWFNVPLNNAVINFYKHIG